MNVYSRKYLRKRFIDKQQSQMVEDAKLPDPADAYRELVKELEKVGQALNIAASR